MPSIVYASSLNVLPLKVFITPDKKTDSLVLKNEGDETVTIKVKVYEWTQNDKGADITEKAAEDIAYMPKILTINAKGEGRIKIGYNYDKGSEPAERTYRIIIEEVPQSFTSDTPVLKIALRISVPIFIAPSKKAVPSGKITGVNTSKGALSFDIENTGKTHFQITKASVAILDASGKEIGNVPIKSWYVLSGKKRPHSAEIPPDICKTAAKLAMTAEAAGLTLKETVNVDKKMCN
ncbi:MAG: fimbria/pilus periplasmic chaperone [Deltaproteobacteria bacterium]|nr:fimbria/pilus periplasmic chaperone [Deltaproteobacteria bacterium]